MNAQLEPFFQGKCHTLVEVGVAGDIIAPLVGVPEGCAIGSLLLLVAGTLGGLLGSFLR